MKWQVVDKELNVVIEKADSKDCAIADARFQYALDISNAAFKNGRYCIRNTARESCEIVNAY